MRSRNLYSWLQAGLAFCGAADAGTLYWAHKSNVELPCTSGGGCDLVYQSHWSHILILHHSIPIALVGAFAYAVILLTAALKLTSESERLSRGLHKFLFLICAIGTIISWYLQDVSAVDIGAFCIYCRVSAIIMTLIFISSVAEVFQMKMSKQRVGLPNKI
jgi:uncharacterized membrane protein